jgi:dihydrodipicolinate synthase/N-acetylneuraminate lyase
MNKKQRPTAEIAPGITPGSEDRSAFRDLTNGEAEMAALAAKVGVPAAIAGNGNRANNATDAMLQRWFGGRMSEAEAIELAMAEDIHEWNLDY